MRYAFFRFSMASALVAGCLLLTPMRALADMVYAVSGAGGGASTLYTIDPTNGAVTATIGTVTVGGTGVMVSSIAYNPLDHGLYGCAVDPISGKGELLTINMSTGAANVVGPFGLTPPNTNTTSLAFSPTGALIGYVKTGSQPESFFAINAATGAAALIGSSAIGSTSGNGLAFNSAGTLYFAGKGATGALYTVDPATGKATAGPTLSNAPLTLSQMKGLAFDASGTLYGIDLQPTSFLAHFVTIDPTTGLITDLGATQSGLTSIAFVSTAVPEPGSLALVGSIAIAWGLRARRRSRPTVN